MQNTTRKERIIHEWTAKKFGMFRNRMFLLDTCTVQYISGILPRFLFLLEDFQTSQNIRLGLLRRVNLCGNRNSVLSHMYLYFAGNYIHRNDVDGDTFYHIAAAAGNSHENTES